MKKARFNYRDFFIYRNIHRTRLAIKIGCWAFKNPEVLHISNFQMLSDLFMLIMQVATEGRHMMTHVAHIHPQEGEKHIVSLWAGAGIGAEPTKRIAELLVENEMLKSQLLTDIDKK